MPGERIDIVSEHGLAAALLAAASDLEFPQYGYGVIQASALAARLGVTGMSVLELGVAGGNGLVYLERVAEKVRSSLRVDVYGFDLGSGMPEPLDFRDTPYIWRSGFFSMDEAALRRQLRDAELILGDVAETGPEFLSSHPSPIGFVSFDLDYYSSTSSAFAALLTGPHQRYLPRVICYFDDTVGPHHEMHSEFTGELRAIAEFNAASEHRKLAEIRGLRYKLAPCDASWMLGMYVLHLFDHPQYNDYIYPNADRQFPLTETQQ